MARRALSLFLTLVLLSTCSGCTFIGLGIGASIPKTAVYGVQDPVGPALTRASLNDNLDVGDDMVVYTRSTALDAPSPSATPESIEIGAPPPPPPVVPIPAVRVPREVSGRFHSLDRTTLRVDSEDYFAEIPLERIEKVRVSRGSHWLAGLLIGFGVDSVCAAVTTAIIVNGLGQLR